MPKPSVNHLEINPNYTAISSWWQHVPIAYWLIEKTKPAVLVELGTHYGVSFFAFCQAAQLFSPTTRLYAVDTWEGDSQAGYYQEQVYETVSQHAQAHYKDQAELIRTTFEEATHRFEEASIDLLHIDGFHSFEAVQTDYNTWKSKMKPTGIIIFHDIVVHAEGFGVWQFWQNIQRDFPNATLQDTVWPGLGILFLNGIPEHLRLDWEQTYPIMASKGLLLAELEQQSRQLQVKSNEIETYQSSLEYTIRHLEHKKSELDQIKKRMQRFWLLRFVYRLVKLFDK
ncbi:MAG: class I SAM-dependent methyltransferase [Chitinophagaceae bacterium]